MAQALIRKLKDETLADYRAAARAHGRSLEAELRDLIERNRPKLRLTADERRLLSDRLAALSAPEPESLPLLHEAREQRLGGLDAGY
jgi:antitoxin FitA